MDQQILDAVMRDADFYGLEDVLDSIAACYEQYSFQTEKQARRAEILRAAAEVRSNA